MRAVFAQEFDADAFQRADDDIEDVFANESFYFPPPMNIPQQKVEQERTFTLEYIALAILGLYLVAFYIGKRNNENHAINWMKFLKPVFDMNFVHVGVSDKQEKALLQKDAYNEFRFYATGRRNCGYILATLTLKKRQDLMSQLLWNIVWPEKDKMLVEIPVQNLQNTPLVLGLVRRNQLKTTRGNYEDLKVFTELKSVPGLPQALAVLGENEESVKQIFDAKVISALAQYQNCIEIIHITDQKQFRPTYPLTLSAVFNIPSDFRDLESLSRLTEILLYITDLMSQAKLSQGARLQAEKERRIFQEEQFRQNKEQREEQLQQKRADRKKEQEQKLAGLSKEAKRRYDEREHKKQLKKQQPKFKIVKG